MPNSSDLPSVWSSDDVNVLSHFFRTDNGKNIFFRSRLVLSEHSEPVDATGAEIHRKCAANDDVKVREAVEDYISKNATSVSLRGLERLPYAVTLFTEEESHELFQGDGLEGWRKFWDRYPDGGGRFELSRIGWSKDRTVAFFYFGFMAGFLCGLGRYFALRRYGDGWRYDRRAKAARGGWIS